MPTITLFGRINVFTGYEVSGLTSWEITGLSTLSPGTIATNTVPNGWSVDIDPPIGAIVTSPQVFKLIINSPTAFSVVGHFTILVSILTEDSGGAMALFPFSSDTRFEDRALTITQDDELANFVTEDETTLTHITDPDYSVHDYNFVEGRYMASWEYEFGDGDTETSAINDVDHEYPDEDTYNGRYRVFDQYGLPQDGSVAFPGYFEAGWWPFSVLIVVAGRVISGLSDHDGVSYVAAKVESDVKVYKYTDGKPTEDLMYTLAGHSAPSIYQHKNDATIYLAAKRNSDSVYRLLKSENLADTFTFMANSPFASGTYKTPVSCDLSDGRHAQAAIRKTDDPIENVYFSYSTDGITWETPVFAFALTAIKGIDIYEENRSGSSVIVITATNNVGTYLTASSHGGLADSWVNYEDLE